MIKSVIFITRKDWNSTFQSLFSAEFPETSFTFIDRKEQLNDISDDVFNRSRLIAFFTDIIVPKNILDKVSFGSYNFHPSTPNRRGWAPLNYALLEGDAQSGVTLSYMTKEVDNGPIIGIENFKIGPADSFISTNNKIFESAFRLLKSYRNRLFFEQEHLLPLPISWGRHFKTQADLFIDTIFDPSTVDENQLNQLIRAFGYTQELCLLRFKQGNKTFFFDYTKQSSFYNADIELFNYKFYKLDENEIPVKLKKSPTFYLALLKSLKS